MKKEEKEQFKKKVVQLLQEKMGSDYEVKVHEVLKTNVSLDGVTIVDKKNASTVIPTIYLNEFYNDYASDMELNEIVDAIVESYRSSCQSAVLDTEQLLDFEQSKAKVCCKLINIALNENRLKEIPYVKYLDLAVVFYLVVHMDKKGCSSMLVNNALIKHWGVDTDTLYAIGMDNTKSLFHCQIRDMEDLLMEAIIQDYENRGIVVGDEMIKSIKMQLKDNVTLPMYVLSNDKWLQGSILMTDVDVLEEFAYTHDASYVIIIPATLHEVILIPTGSLRWVDMLNEVVKKVNEDDLSKEDQLSDHCYLYKRGANKINVL